MNAARLVSPACLALRRRRTLDGVGTKGSPRPGRGCVEGIGVATALAFRDAGGRITAAGRPGQRLDAIGEELGITVTVHLIVIAFRRHREMVRGCNRTGRTGKLAVFGSGNIYRNGAPNRIRTCGLCLRSNLTCPSTLYDGFRYDALYYCNH